MEPGNRVVFKITPKGLFGNTGFDWDTHFTIRAAIFQNSTVFPISGTFGRFSLQIHFAGLALVSAGRSACQGTASVCPSTFFQTLTAFMEPDNI